MILENFAAVSSSSTSLIDGISYDSKWLNIHAEI